MKSRICLEPMLKFWSLSGWGLCLLIGLFLCLLSANVRAETLEREQQMTCPFCKYQWTDYNYGRVERCPNCKRDKNGNLPSSGSSYSPGTMPIPQTWDDVRNNVGQSLINSVQQGIQQGIQNNQAAQQEAARRAAEAERRRQEILQQAAEQARVNWQEQDAANMAAFSTILSSKKSGSGMSSLLMKQAALSSGAGNDPNVVDLSGTTNRTPQIPGSGAAKISDGGFRGPLGAPVSPVPLFMDVPPPEHSLSLEELLPDLPELPPEYVAHIKKLANEMGKDYAMMTLKKGLPSVAKCVSFASELKEAANLKNQFVGVGVGLATPTFDAASGFAANVNNPRYNSIELSEQTFGHLDKAGNEIDTVVSEFVCSKYSETSKKAKLGGNVIDAANLNLKQKGAVTK